MSLHCSYTMFAVVYQVDKNIDPTATSTARDKETCLSQIGIIKYATTEAEKARLRAHYGLKETFNPLFSLSVDLYK